MLKPLQCCNETLDNSATLLLSLSSTWCGNPLLPNPLQCLAYAPAVKLGPSGLMVENLPWNQMQIQPQELGRSPREENGYPVHKINNLWEKLFTKRYCFLILHLKKCGTKSPGFFLKLKREQTLNRSLICFFDNNKIKRQINISNISVSKIIPLTC